MESKTYQQAEVMTDRLDYLNPMGNNLAYCLAVEKLVDLDVPPRAQAMRVILAELTRINSHLVWMGTSALDLAAMSVFLYGMREREMILDIFEMCSGQRMMTTYIRPGGLWRDVPVEFEARGAQVYLEVMPRRLDEYESLLTKNPLFLDRTQDIGVISAEDCHALGHHRPGRCAARAWLMICARRGRTAVMSSTISISRRRRLGIFMRVIMVRVEEMRQSLRIIEQAMDQLPLGPVRSNNRKFVPPPRSEIGVSMEALIHHFKLWTEGFSAPAAVFMPRRKARVVSWVSTWKVTAAPSLTACISARLLLPICRSCRCSRTVILWPMWSVLLAVLILFWEMQTGEPIAYPIS